MTTEDFQMHALAALKSIDNTLKELLALSRSKKNAAAGPAVDLDDQYGNPVVNARDPKNWSGAPMKGKRFSECPPEYLDMLAERFDYFAANQDDQQKKKWNLLDAARARGWAVRLRAGYKPSTPPADKGVPDW